MSHIETVEELTEIGFLTAKAKSFLKKLIELKAVGVAPELLLNAVETIIIFDYLSSFIVLSVLDI